MLALSFGLDAKSPIQWAAVWSVRCVFCALALVGASELVAPSLMDTLRGLIAGRQQRSLERGLRLRERGLLLIQRRQRLLGEPVGASKEKRVVLMAMGDLFLDTETDAEGVGRVLASSPYRWTELDDILRVEVAPALHWNLMSIAGEWTGWQEEWLVEETLLKRNNWIGRFGPLRWARGWLTTRIVASDWGKVRSAFTRIRAGRGGEGASR